ncbi:hypothetical protein CTRI78_v007900 [Colletotrichum trifolii]|uniref:Protein F37C4.5 n=1 Tax=Colletotrichum trifolii TaxID=5466 RepID=A0A4R8R8U1_COLTR|nr:hypothetical protein CTRI78_v007900 [Colletotrichum trifolii]
MDTVNKTEYHVRDLATRSVTLFPSRAQVVRDLKDVTLKPGTNEIAILGLTPTVDESTIKVEGTGSAVISNIAIELLPNRDIFQDVYPESDDEEMDVDSDDSEEDDVADSPELEALRTRLFDLRDEERRAKEIVESAASRLKILDAFGNSLDRNKNLNITEGVDTYRDERDKVFQDHMTGIIRGRENAKHLAAALKEEARLVKLKYKEAARLTREKLKSHKVKEKKKQQDQRRRAERQKEKQRVLKERQRFWPKLCYSDRVTLEAQAFSPLSSRRTSVSSDTAQPLVATADAEKGAIPLCDLSLTYVTSSASWAPSYDLQLSTTTNNAVLCYDASITNQTSETWTNCKVTLSTSQTTFAGLENEIPTLKTWKIKLAPKNSVVKENNVTSSNEERQHRAEWLNMQQPPQAHVPQSALFGIDNSAATPEAARAEAMRQRMRLQAHAQFPQSMIQQSHPFQSMESHRAMQVEAMQAAPRAGGGGLFGQPPQSSSATFGNASGGLFGQPSQPPSAPSQNAMAFGKPSGISAFGSSKPVEAEEEETYPPDQEALDFQESVMEETGFTTTYDLPGAKTLPPRPTASKQRVARLTFSNVAFSHTVVAKYKPAAYLKAKVRNGSRLTLLKGAAGLTLDGTFMGRTKLPRCSAGDLFSLSLGIDPAIAVNYPKVDVRRATTGFFSKENSSVYSRSVTIANSRASAGKPVSVVVLDQVPVSEDERLKVDILAPKGLLLDGSGVADGRPARGEKEDGQWGKATAILKKGGQVEWSVTLNAGKAVKLGLEYVVAMPSGDSAVEC